MAGLQAAKEAGRWLELMKLSNNLGAVQRKKLGKFEDAYFVHQVSTPPMLHCQYEYTCIHVCTKDM